MEEREEREERIKRLKRLKRKRLVTMLALFLLLAGLCGGYYAASRYKAKKAEEEAKKQEEQGNGPEEFTVTSFSYADVAAVDYTNEENSYRFVRTESDAGDVWVREGMEEFPTKNSKLQTIIKSICNLTSTAKIDGAGERLSEYGLEDPVVSIKITLSDGTVHRFRLGEEAPYSAGYYLLQEETGEVWVAGSSVYTQFSTTEMKLVQEETFPQISKENITKAEVALRGEEGVCYEPQTAEDGTVTYPALFTDCEKFIASTIQEYNCTDFAAYGLADPYLTVTVSYLESVISDGALVKENRTATLELGDLTVSGNYYVRVNGSPFVYIMTAANAKKYIP